MKKQWGFAAIAAALLLPANIPADADDTPAQAVTLSLGQPLVVLSHNQARNFNTALQALAVQGHVAFVAEDRPLHMTLAAKDVEAMPTAAAPLAQTVEALASRYDYDARCVGAVFYLTKRYNDPKDLPAVTLQECLLSLEDVQRITSRFNPDVPEEQYGTPNPLVGDLAASLTPDQIKSLHNRTLLVSTLAPGQQAQVWRMAGYFYVQRPLLGMPAVLPQLREAARTDGRLELQWGGAGPQRDLGYDLPDSESNQPRHYWLCSAAVGQQETKASPEAGTEITLADAAAQLNLRRVSSIPYSVDAAMRAKLVTIVGSPNVKPEDIWLGLAAVYGLHIITKGDGRQVLTRYSVDVAARMSEVPKAIRRAMPLPFLHALHLDALDEYDRQYERQVNRLYEIAARNASAKAPGNVEKNGQPEKDQTAQDEKDRQEFSQVVERKNKISRQLAYMFPGMYGTATTRLRLDLAAKLDAARTQGVPLSALNESDKRAFAVALTIKFLQALTPLLREQVPGYVARFDQLYLTGGEETDSKGGKHLGIFLSLPTPDGRVFQQVGVGVPLNNPSP